MKPVKRGRHFPSRAFFSDLLGVGGPFGFVMPILTIVLIVYQVARFAMTYQISLMRDAEERSGISPSRQGMIAYPNLYKIHRVLTVLEGIAFLAFVFRAVQFLGVEVIFFGGG